MWKLWIYDLSVKWKKKVYYHNPTSPQKHTPSQIARALLKRCNTQSSY